MKPLSKWLCLPLETGVVIIGSMWICFAILVIVATFFDTFDDVFYNIFQSVVPNYTDPKETLIPVMKICAGIGMVIEILHEVLLLVAVHKVRNYIATV